MGVALSSNSTESPFAFAGGVIGIISFAFTVGTFVRVMWINLHTMFEAPQQVHGYLLSLRTEIYEEKAYLKMIRRQCRKWHRSASKDKSASLMGIGLDEMSIKSMNETVKMLMKRFQEMERPFLSSEDAASVEELKHRGKNGNGRRKSGSGSQYYEHAAYGLPGDRRKRLSRDEEDDGPFVPLPALYGNFSFAHRLAWIRRKGEAQQLWEDLSRIQIRRMGRQVTAMSVLMDDFGGVTSQIQDDVGRIDQRMNNIVGVRRIND